jgi:hypothetical protein
MSLLQTLTSALPGFDTRTIGDIEREIVDELEFHIICCPSPRDNSAAVTVAALRTCLCKSYLFVPA